MSHYRKSQMQRIVFAIMLGTAAVVYLTIGSAHAIANV